MLLLAVVATMLVHPMLSPARLSCRLEGVPPYRGGEPVLVRFRLRNRGPLPVGVLNWNTPLEGLLADMFAIRRAGGARLPWNGPSIKRGEPDAEEYVTIAAGRVVTEDVDLALGYDLRAPGRYSIGLRLRIHDVAAAGAHVPRPRSRHASLSLDCGGLEILIR